MKKLVGLSVIIMLFSLSISAQRQGQRQNKNADFTPEQIAVLQTKKMALRLDLDDKQQKEVQKMMLKSAEERQKFRAENQKNKQDGTGLTNDERFERANMRLTKQQAHKAEMKKILTKEQFEKWENSNRKAMKKGNMKKGKKQGSREGNGSKKQVNNRG